MKHLLLLRHAKSSRDDPSLRDFDRPLNDRGVKACKLIGRFLRDEKIKIDLVISSPAKRARQTTELIMKAAQVKAELKFDERIYEAGPHSLLAVVSEIKNAVNSVALVGHNPGFEDLLKVLTGNERRLPTASLAFIDLDIDEWRKATGGGKLNQVVKPKRLEPSKLP